MPPCTTSSRRNPTAYEGSPDSTVSALVEEKSVVPYGYIVTPVMLRVAGITMPSKSRSPAATVYEHHSALPSENNSHGALCTRSPMT